MLKIGAIVWGVPEIQPAVEFWTQALDYQLAFPAGQEFAILVPRQGDGFQLSLNRVRSPKPQRHHMDLFSNNALAEVERLLGLGAKRKAWKYGHEANYVVLEDPQGNAFCVIQQSEDQA